MIVETQWTSVGSPLPVPSANGMQDGSSFSSSNAFGCQAAIPLLSQPDPGPRSGTCHCFRNHVVR